ncbi:MAG: DUF4124 domain-containing protein [Halioglobus sp.]
MPRLFFVLLLLLFSASGSAVTVYKTVDGQGVVSFSDTPPVGDADAEVLQIVPAQAHEPEVYLQRFEDMRETTDRMAMDRREREKHRVELNEQRARAASYRQPAQVGYTESSGYYSAYSRRYGNGGHIPWRPGFRPKPEHPIVRPPHRPGYGSTGSSNKQLMRPLVSSQSRGAGRSNSQLMRPLVSTGP